MVGWHHQLSGHEFEQALADGEGQESLVCCSPWGRKELDMIERLNHSTAHAHSSKPLSLLPLLLELSPFTFTSHLLKSYSSGLVQTY